jgi:FixJ family two-component response regulator
MSSAEGDFNLLGAAKQLGAVAALRKPFTKDVLLAAVAAILAPKPGSTSVSTAPCT